MRIYKTKEFHKWACGIGLSDTDLRAAVAEIEDGLVDANLGGNVFKKRVALAGRGKRGGTRTLLAYQNNDRAFFMYGFEKNARENINRKELFALKLFAKELLGYNSKEITKAIKGKALIEVKYDG